MYGIIKGSTYSSYLTSSQTLQNKATSAIAKLKSKDRVTPIYKQYNLLKTNDIYRFEIAKFMHHFHTKSFPFFLTDYVIIIKLRFPTAQIFFSHYSSSRLQRFIKYSGVKLWNCIPENIKKLSHKILLWLIKKSQLTNTNNQFFYFF